MKKGEGKFVLQAGEQETLSMEVSPESYMDKVPHLATLVTWVTEATLVTGVAWSP